MAVDMDLFDGMRLMVREWFDKNRVADIAEIRDERIRRCFFIFMEEVEREPAWGGGRDPSQIRFMKKAALFACSKVGNDGAYSHVVGRVMARIHKEELFKEVSHG